MDDGQADGEPTHVRGPVGSRRTRRMGRFRGQGLGAAAIVTVVVAGLGLPRRERSLPPTGLCYDAATAQAAPAAVAGAMITQSGFMITAATLVVQTVRSMSARLIGVVRHFTHSPSLVGSGQGRLLPAPRGLPEHGQQHRRPPDPLHQQDRRLHEQPPDRRRPGPVLHGTFTSRKADS
ncbi:hypothetical protein [Streptomyces sp. NRRL B-24572]|uniref:hypothetical protein n=1 Tax=Streptomyces sp. NRRL B-24572 TaxID=1962156 RepID=UPI0011809B18|nr:hypothetical protein [Streptomyces sp. NRRL B-24572]